MSSKNNKRNTCPSRYSEASSIAPTQSTPPTPPTPPTPRCQLSPKHFNRADAKPLSTAAGLLPMCLFLSSGFQSDLTITFRFDDTEIKVHRMVLAMHSPVLKCMVEKCENDTIQLCDDSPAAIHWLVHHLYCGLRHLPSVELAIEVFVAAEKYFLYSAVPLASKVMAQHLNTSYLHLWNTYDIAVLAGHDELISLCEKHLEQHTDELISLEPFRCISRVSMHYLLASMALSPSSELLLFEHLLKWASYRVEIYGENSCDSPTLETPLSPHSSLNYTIRVEIQTLLPYVRFLSMTLTEVIKEVVDCGVFTAEEGLQLVRVMAGCPNVSLPAIASCTIQVPRKRKAVTESKKVQVAKRAAIGRMHK